MLGFGATSAGGALGIILATVIGLAGLWVVWRSLRIGLRWDGNGLRYVGFFRTRHIGWDVIERINAEVVDNKIVFDVVAPVFHLADSSELVGFAVARFVNPSSERSSPTDELVGKLNDSLNRYRSVGA